MLNQYSLQGYYWMNVVIELQETEVNKASYGSKIAAWRVKLVEPLFE